MRGSRSFDWRFPIGREFSKNDGVHRDVVSFGKGVIDELKRVADANLEGVGTGVGQHAVVEASASAKATAVSIKCEAWAEECVDFPEWDFRRVRMRLKDVKSTGAEKFTGVEGEVAIHDFREKPADPWVPTDEGR